MRISVLDDRVEAAEVIAVGAGDLRRLQRIQNRLVVLVDQHRNALTGSLVQRLDQVAEAGRRGVGAIGDRRVIFHRLQPIHHLRPQVARPLEVASAKAQTQDGMANRPVPAVMDGKPVEQCLTALEQLLRGIEEQALAEPARARQEEVLALVQQPPDKGRLVHVVAIILADLAERLDADGEPAPRHVRTIPRREAMSKSGVHPLN